MKNVKIVGASRAYQIMFEQLGYTPVDRIEDAHLVCFTGGEDVNPTLYQAQKDPRTRSSINRDVQDVAFYLQAKKKGLPCVGICRGGQFLNVMSGGSMVQHVEGHTRQHLAYPSGRLQGTPNGFVTSTHHQVMFPSTNEPYEVFAVGDSNDDGYVPYEIVFYPELGNLCFQPHPEFERDSEYTRLLFKKSLEECF